MRVQHNIMAMNAYRNYTNNVSAMKKNLEKLSSGYKINRAGDDAAGLAISEKMRAQITGLKTAQKNAKDGISLVQTAEGALTEVHDMLNRMVELATQSANGTYESGTDRTQLQKEINQLRDEINRIADSANFNGIKLLDGSMATSEASSEKVNISGLDRIIKTVASKTDVAHEVSGTKTVLDNGATAGTKAKFEVDLNTLTITNKSDGDSQADTSLTAADFTLTIGGTDLKATGLKFSDDASNVATSVTVANLAKGFMTTAAGSSTATSATVKINDVDWKLTVNGTKLTFEQVNVPTTEAETKANFDVKISVADDNGVTTLTGAVDPGTFVNTAGVAKGDAKTANTIFNINKEDIVDGAKLSFDGTNYTLKVGKDSTVTAPAPVIDLSTIDADDVNLDKALGLISNALTAQSTNFEVGDSDATKGFPTGITVQKKTGITKQFDTIEKLADVFSMSYTKETAATSALTLQIGDTADSYNQLKVEIADCHVAALGLDGIDVTDQDNAAKAIDVIKAAINKVSDVRGTLGATQNRLDHTINNLSVMTENIQDAESTIRDTDIAEEMMAYTKNNILIQSAQAMLAQANQVPQGVLQLLG